MKKILRRNTKEEEAAINRGIMLDPDAPELTDAFFANARPAGQTIPPELYEALTKPSQHIGKNREKAPSG